MPSLGGEFNAGAGGERTEPGPARVPGHTFCVLDTEL